MPGPKCCPEAVWKAKGTFILAANPEFCAWATGASEATVRIAAIKPAGTFNMVEVRMVVSPCGRRLINRLHLLRRCPGKNSEMEFDLFRIFFGRLRTRLQLVQHPDSRQRPIALYGSRRKVQQTSNFFEGKAPKVTQLHDPCLPRIDRLQFFQ